MVPSDRETEPSARNATGMVDRIGVVDKVAHDRLSMRWTSCVGRSEAGMSAIATPSATRCLSRAAHHAPPRVVAAATSLLNAASERQDLDPFFAQVVEALARLAGAPDTSALAASESTFDALVRMLDRPELLAELQPRDPLAAARLRGLRLQREILAAEGGSVSGQTLAEALGITRQAVDKRRKRGTLIGLSLGRRGYAYPVWQIGLSGLEDVLAELTGLDPWTQAAYLLAPNRWLEGQAPLDALRAGKLEALLAAARLYGEQVAA